MYYFTDTGTNDIPIATDTDISVHEKHAAIVKKISNSMNANRSRCVSKHPLKVYYIKQLDKFHLTFKSDLYGAFQVLKPCSYE